MTSLDAWLVMSSGFQFPCSSFDGMDGVGMAQTNQNSRPHLQWPLTYAKLPIRKFAHMLSIAMRISCPASEMHYDPAQRARYLTYPHMMNECSMFVYLGVFMSVPNITYSRQKQSSKYAALEPNGYHMAGRSASFASSSLLGRFSHTSPCCSTVSTRRLFRVEGVCLPERS